MKIEGSNYFRKYKFGFVCKYLASSLHTNSSHANWMSNFRMLGYVWGSGYADKPTLTAPGP